MLGMRNFTATRPERCRETPHVPSGKTSTSSPIGRSVGVLVFEKQHGLNAAEPRRVDPQFEPVDERESICGAEPFETGEQALLDRLRRASEYRFASRCERELDTSTIDSRCGSGNEPSFHESRDNFGH